MGGSDDEAPHTSRCDGRAPRDTKAYTLLAPASNEGPAQVTIYLNLDSDEVYTEEEVMECYDRDVAQLIADNPVPQLPTYDEWLEDFLNTRSRSSRRSGSPPGASCLYRYAITTATDQAQRNPLRRSGPADGSGMRCRSFRRIGA